MQPHEVRDDDADEADRPGERDGGARGQRRAEKREPLRPRDVHATRGGRVVAETEQVQRRGQHGEYRERGDDRAAAAPSSGAKPPTSRSPISQRTVRIHLREVGQVLHEQDQRREERIERDAGQQQHRRRHRAARPRRQPVDDRRARAIAPARLASGTGDSAPSATRRAERDREHRAERRAGRHAEGERRRQRVAQHRLEDHAAERERRRRRARRPARAAGARRRRSARRRCRRTESTDRSARQADLRAADERRQQARGEREQRRSRTTVSTAARAARRRRARRRPRDDRRCELIDVMRAAPAPPSGGRLADETRRRHRRRTAARMFAGVSTSRSAPCAMHAAAAHQTRARSHSDAARFKSCVASTIVTPRSRLSAREQRCDFELVAEIERRRRLVEQQDARLPARARWR